jgi:catalase
MTGCHGGVGRHNQDMLQNTFADALLKQNIKLIPMNTPEKENEYNQNQDNENEHQDQNSASENQDERNQEMNDKEQSQTSEEPSEFSGVINASMEGTTEQQPLAQAYEAARPSFELESEENKEEDEEM